MLQNNAPFPAISGITDPSNARLAMIQGTQIVSVPAASSGLLPITLSGIPFEFFLPFNYDYTTDDASTAMETAAAYSASHKVTIRFSRRYRLENNVTIDDDDVQFHFENAQFDILDTDLTAEIDNGAAGPIGILVKGTSTTPLVGVKLTGSARLIGQGTEGTTRLAGIVFDHVNFPECGKFYYENMAAGRMVFHCAFGLLCAIQADKMRGTQTFSGSDTAGTAEVVAGCRDSWFGPIESQNNYKPIRYLSVLEDGLGAKINNERCHFERADGTAYPGSEESSITSIRSAKKCTFAGGAGTGFNKGLYVVRYNTDTGWGTAVDDIDCGIWHVDIDNTAASVDSGIECSIEGPTVPLGKIRIGSATVKALDASGGAEFGFFANSGSISIEHLSSDGFTYSAQFHSCHVEIENITSANADQAAIRYGLGVSGYIRNLNITTGTAASGRTSHIAYTGALGSTAIARFEFGKVRYYLNGTGNNVLYVFFDATNSANIIHIDNIEGTGSTNVARWLSDAITPRDGKLYSTAAPTTGTWLDGDFVLNIAPAANGVMGWQCTTPGTPGTWSIVPVLDSATGFLAQTAAGAFAKRSLTSTANHLTITNPAGIAGNAVLDLAVGPILTGSYTPTITNGANVDASVASTSYYQRIGNQVNVWGGFTVDPTAAANTVTVVTLSLPVASNIGSARDLIGTGASNVLQGPAIITGNVAGDVADYSFLSGVTTNHTHSFHFSYRII